jgi:hypothetical protein
MAATSTARTTPSLGNADNWGCTVKPGHEAPEPEEYAAPVTTVMPAAHQAPMLSSGQLAFTGAETSVPLTLGPLALGAGGALTLAGRRRETTTVDDPPVRHSSDTERRAGLHLSRQDLE